MIERYVKKIARHTAVYWGSPVARPDGSLSYGEPVEIKCFWREGYLSDPDRDIREISVKAQVYVLQDLDEGGMLMLGTLADLSAEAEADPRLIPRAYEITKFNKIPSIHVHGEYNRTAIIAPEIARIPPGIERT